MLELFLIIVILRFILNYKKAYRKVYLRGRSPSSQSTINEILSHPSSLVGRVPFIERIPIEDYLGDSIEKPEETFDYDKYMSRKF